jgi:hypothetical protein
MDGDVKKKLLKGASIRMPLDFILIIKAGYSFEYPHTD